MINFTKEQQKAIETNDMHLRIIACAGSGKTSTVAGKVVYLLNPFFGLSRYTTLPATVLVLLYNELNPVYYGNRYGWCQSVTRKKVTSYLISKIY